MTPSTLRRRSFTALGIGSALTLLVLAGVDPTGSTWALVWVAYAVMASWVLWRQPSNRIGWLMLAIALVFTSVTLVNWYATSARSSGPVAVETSSSVLGGVGWLTFLLMVMLFPDGVVRSRSQAWLVRTGWTLMAFGALVTIGSPNALPDTGRLGPFAGSAVASVSQAAAPVIAVLLGLLPLAVLVDLILRWRASAGVPREQFKWFFWGAVISVAVLAVGSSASNSVGPEALAYAVWVIGGAALPVSIAIAVMRYRLYDIDRVISRTTSYGVVTAVLAATFAALVALGSSLLGSDNQLGVAAATLVVAAIARPVYRRVQHGVDRRFDRARYDGRRTVDAFGQRLSHEVDANAVSVDLQHTVQETMAPQMVGLRLREAQ